MYQSNSPCLGQLSLRLRQSKLVHTLGQLTFDPFSVWDHEGPNKFGLHTIPRQLQEKLITAKKPLYFAFIDLQKAFDCVPRKVLWWSLRGVGVENGQFV